MPNAQVFNDVSEHMPFQRGLLGALNLDVAQKVLAASGDVSMVIDADGRICDIAASADMAREGAEQWLDQRWSDIVSDDSRHKVDELLSDALSKGRTRWREINQVSADKDPIAIRYVAVDAGRDGHVIAIGRDDRASAAMQQRLLEAQQVMERDYAKLRDVEFRYRLLFQMSGEAVIIVDASTRRIVEANPAAERLLGKTHGSPFGESFARVFDEASQDDAARLLTTAQTSNRAPNSGVTLKCVGHDVVATASIFRQERTTQFLVRLVPAGSIEVPEPDSDRRLQDVLERLPDAFVMTDGDARILTVNSAFLDLARIGSPAQAEGQLLNSFLGRAGLERDILIDNIRAHGSIRNFSTTLRTQLGEIEDVEISGVFVESDNAPPCYGLTIRAVRRASPTPGVPRAGLSRSVEQLSELVGRVTLKELVRESTDLVERLCIEAALELTRNNRASAAEILGLSRQGLYSKLHKFGLGNLSSDEP